MESQIQVKINQASNVRLRSKTYTLYEIRVQSNTFFPWLLHKRYREFEALHQGLKAAKNLQNIKSCLPDFPPKRYTSRLSPEVVEQRRVQLEQYLQGVIKMPEFARVTELLDFLIIPENVRNMLDSTAQPKVTPSRGDKLNEPGERGAKQLNIEQQEIQKLLRQMSIGHHKVRAIQNFTDFFFEHRPRLNPTDIDMLLKGNDKYAGIIKNCGNHYYSKVSRRAALTLLIRLLDIERNKDANSFLDRFCSLKEAVLMELSLEQHIASMNNQLEAFKLLHILKARKPEIANDILKSDVLEQQYLLWERLQAEAPIPVSEHKTASQVEAENLADRSFEAIGDSCLDEVKSVILDAEDWKSADLIDENNIGIKCLYKRMECKAMEPEEWRMKATMKGVEASPEEVMKMLCARHQDWNPKVVKHEVVKDVDERHNLIYQVYSKPFYSADPHKERDFCLLQSLRGEPGVCWLLYTSVDHRDFPEPKECIRTISKPCGWKISESKNSRGKKTDVVFAASLTGETILLLSPDLLGDSDHLVQLFAHIKNAFK